jgi:hypothetical protein
LSGEQHPIHLSAQALERVASLRLSGLPLATFLALLARLDSAGRAEITQPELGKLLSTGPGKVWQSLQALVAAGVIDSPVDKPALGVGRRIGSQLMSPSPRSFRPANVRHAVDLSYRALAM